MQADTFSSLSSRQTGPESPAAASGPAASLTALADLTIDVLDTMEPLRAEWARLERDEANSLHQGYDWCSAWAATQGVRLTILHGRLKGETVFILPLEITRHGVVRVAQFLAGRFSNINTGLFDPDFRAGLNGETARAFSKALTLAMKGRADLIVLRNMPAQWRGAPSVFANLPAVENQNHAFQMPLLGGFEAALRQVNAKRRRKKFRLQGRRLEAIGGYDHVIADTAEEKHRLLDKFFEQKAVRFKALGLPNVFHAERIQSFFHGLLDAPCNGLDMPLEMHAIRLKGAHDGHIAAIAGLSRKGEHVICQFGSIDESVAADASPGELLFWLMIERACGQGAALFDFGIGDQAYKRCWCSQETVQYDVLIPVTGIGRIAALGQQALTRAKGAIKGNARIYGLIQRLRAGAAPAPQAARDATAED